MLNWIIFSILTSKPSGYPEKFISKWIWLYLADTIAVYHYHKGMPVFGTIMF